jgi:hypothetical protein
MPSVYLDEWDPLATSDDQGMVVAAQKREIGNILKSYTGYYDLFAELIQNSLDAVEKRMKEGAEGYEPSIWITIDLSLNSVTVTDNGCGMNLSEFRGFMKPNFSYKDGAFTRGNKGVGATYLAYGFNSLTIATKQSEDEDYVGQLKDGRNWIDDTKGIVNRPKVAKGNGLDPQFTPLDRGTSMTLKLSGNNIRPKNLAYFGATTANQWQPILRAHTPLGGIYLCGENPPPVKIRIKVITADGTLTESDMDCPRYLYPHEVLGKTADLRDFLKDQQTRAGKSQDLTKVPPRFTNLNGIWGEWTGDQLLNNQSPIRARLEKHEIETLKSLDVKIYVFMGYTTDLWDTYNDRTLALRKGSRVLRGGLQQATKHMPQGHPVTIPLTQNIGFQNITHIIVHFENAEPDLGRKGFQPEHTKIAERISVSAVTAFKNYFGTLLRARSGPPALLQGMRLSQWIDIQREHERDHPLIIKGSGLFAPMEELPIRSVPLVEQDVVALFNQMLSSGLVRGIQLLSSSQFNQYDGLFRFLYDDPLDRYIRSETNPLGVEEQSFAGADMPIASPVKVLEYKHNMNSLIEEFSFGVKQANDIGLAVVWEIGDRWKGMFDILSYLDNDNLHHRQFHGITHHFSHSVSGSPAFPVIVLSDLVAYCMDQEAESARQRQEYGIEPLV